VGGSTVINEGDCTRIPAPVLDHWKRLAGVDGYAEGDLAPAYERVERALGVQPVPDNLLNRNNRLLAAGAEHLGHDHGVFRQNRSGCVGSGYCLIGCAYDAKKGAHLTYLPRAVAQGARLQADARAERVVARSGGGWRVEGAIVERATRRARLGFSAEAPVVIVAAGTIHSPVLLARSGLAGASGQLGRNLSLQPQAPVIALFPEPVVAYRGIPQSVYVSAFDAATAEDGLGGFRMEGIVGGPAMSGSLIGGFGLAHKEQMTRFNHVAANLLLVPDRPTGRVEVDRKGRVHIRYEPTAEWKERLRQGLRRSAEIWFAAGADTVMTSSETTAPLTRNDDPKRLGDVPLDPGLFRLISAHPQGTCRLGADARRSVVDAGLEVHGHRGLFVMDASVFPTSASTHTMIPIMAMMDLAAQRLVDRKGSFWGT
ncbi:MAG: GMC family oxidoreductase N-terminal domain-containing protein, partial [Myxococcales bacterium]|nr:GMC family oxidoreductase N-terminal domain-containing protein [Myxococcales bacterium]